MNGRKILWATVAGVLLSFCVVAGRELDIEYSLDLLNHGFYVKWIALAVVLGIVIHFVWERMGTSLRNGRSIPRNVERVCEWLGGRWSGVWIFLMWIPSWLAIFPGVFSYDAYDEWMQVCTGNITSHHPVLHVLFLGGGVELFGQWTGNYNVGIAVCTVTQMILLALTFGYSISFLQEQGVSALKRSLATFFYGLSPVMQLFAISGTKDTLFAAAFLLFLISLYRMVVCADVFWENRSRKLLFVLSGLFTMILRNNGKYVVLITLLILIIVNRTVWKKYLLHCGIMLFVYWMYAGPFCTVIGAEDGSVAEMLSVPLQQLARVYHYEQDSFTEEELDYLYEIVPQENWEMYRSTVADFVKSGFREDVFETDPGSFVSLWLKKGMEHPLTYVNSFLAGTVDFWYPFAVVDGYQDPYGKSSFFDYRVSEPGEEVVLLPFLHDCYERLSHRTEVQKIPGLFSLISPGWYLMVFLLVNMYVCRQGMWRRSFILLPILLNMATVLLGPIALVRYVLILYFVVPLYGVFLGKEPFCVAEKVEAMEKK